ncbi:MAG: hypothetical protein ACLQJF_21130 [Candidatus Sulfotelmatobacter sp.]|jgi:hypothetical protein
MQPTQYRQGSFGSIADTQATAANAYKAGQDVVTNAQKQAQEQSDKQQAFKIATVKNNVDAMHLWAATQHEMGQDAQQQVETAAPMLKIAQDHDQNLQGTDQKAVLGSGMTMKEALAHPEFGQALTRHSIIPDGVIQADDGSGRLVPTQTFSVIDPNVKVSMDKDSVAIASQIYPSWQTAFDNAGGSLQMKLGQIHTITQQVQSVQYAERIFQDAANSDDKAVKALGLKGDINGEIMSAVRQGAPGAAQARQSLMAMENAKAQGGSTIDALDRLVNDPDARPGSAYILNALGTTADKVSKFVRDARLEQERQAVLAKEGGIGDKAPAPPQMVTEITASANRLPRDQRDAIMAGVNPNGMTVGEAEKLKDKVLTSIQQNRTDAANNPKLGTAAPPATFVQNPNASTMDSVDLQKDLTAKGVKLPANFEALYGIAHNANPLTTLPPNPRKGSNQMSAQEGLAFIRQYLNPQYQEGDYPAAAGLSKELASTKVGVAGGSLLNAGVASNHLELLGQAADALKNNDTQALNHLANAFGVQVGKSPAVTFKAIADQVNQEVGKVVAGGAPHEAELQALRDNLNTDQSPEQTRNVIKSYVNLMSGRINEINERSQQYFQRDVKGISPETAKVFAKYGVEVPGYVSVSVNGHVGAIPKNQVTAFKAKYPNATIGAQ